MRIPPYYRSRAWQRLFAGMALGSFISWFIFLYIYGVWQDKHSNQIKKQEKEIQELKEAKSIWQEEFKLWNKKNKEQLTVQDIKIKITNGDKYKLDSFSVFEVEKALKDDLGMLMAKDIESAYNSRDLIRRVIENKTFKINDKRYKLEIMEMIFYTNISIRLHIHLEG